MRPTIPLAEWRLAIDLAATRAVNALDVMPARVCGDCVDCRLWMQEHAAALPARLAHELRRIGIDPARPSDLYRSEDATEDRPVMMRVTYHAVGEILSGPTEFGSRHGRHYVPDPDARDRAYIAVAYQSRIVMPEWTEGLPEPLLAIDLSLSMPSHVPVAARQP